MALSFVHPALIAAARPTVKFAGTVCNFAAIIDGSPEFVALAAGDRS